VTLEEALIRYQLLYGRLRDATIAQARAMWQRFGGPGDGNIDAFLAAIVPLIEGAQVAAARMVAGSFALQVRLETGTGVAVAIAPEAVTIAALRGTAAAEVYTRPVITMRKALADGLDFGDAMRLAGDRVEQLASTDLVMAEREAATVAAEADSRIVGYRRVLRGSSCALCATASTQRYRRKNLMPIHSRCDCGVAPIIGSADPGQVINKPLVRQLKAAAKATGSKDYYKNRHVTVDENGNVTLPDVKVRNHGELGPVLSVAQHAFSGPSVAA
jgi:hypothetical protein